jgi:glycine/D-amino acid oxidase-like deaminating enzyme
VTGIHKSEKQVSTASASRYAVLLFHPSYSQTNCQEVLGVSTSEGDIKCEYVINCAGMWSKQVRFSALSWLSLLSYISCIFRCCLTVTYLNHV